MGGCRVAVDGALTGGGAGCRVGCGARCRVAVDVGAGWQ